MFYALDLTINLLELNPAYPKEPKTLGERIRKARMDKGLLIRELAALIGVSADTVINWELRGVKPTLKCHRQKVVEFLGLEVYNGHIPTVWPLPPAKGCG